MDRSATPGGAVARRTPRVSNSRPDGRRGLLALLSLVILLACADSSITSVGGEEEPVASLADARLSVVSGDAQEGEVGSYLPELLVARVVDGNGEAVSGAPVEWVFYQGAGMLGDGQLADRISTVTDADGNAATRWQLGARQGVQSASAEIAAPAPVSGADASLAPGDNNGKKVGFEANAKPGDIASVSVSPGQATVQVGESMQMTATAIDRFGNVMEGLIYQWRTSDETVVQVSDAGMVQAMTPGSAVITAKYKSLEGAASITSSESTGALAPSAWIVEPSKNVTIAPGDTVIFQGGATDADGSIASHRWEFGDGNGASVEDPGHYVYAREGTYEVSYQVTDDQGLSSPADTSTVTVTAELNAAPTASIVSPSTDATLTLGDAVDFQGSASDPDGSIASHSWSFGDGNTASVEDPGSYTYASAGTYTVSYQVTDDGGATATAERTITVSPSDTEAPTVPVGVSAAAVSSSRIDLTWDASSDETGVEGYYVYRDGSQVAEVDITSYSDTGLGASTSYSYAVAAYDAAGNVSAQSSSASATTGSGSGSASGEVAIPAVGDWTDHGLVLTPGSAGQWDARMFGMITPSSIVRVGTNLILYYIGADGDRSDGGPAHRKLGAATLADGADVATGWTKYGGNPLVSHNPNPGSANENEEGVFSAGAFYDGSTVEVVFGGMEGVGGASVDGDGVRVSMGSDGLTPGSQTLVIDASDSGVWGAGDEIFPVGFYEDSDGEWWSLYTAKPGSNNWSMGWAHGPSPTNLSITEEVTEVSGRAMTGSDPIDIGGGKVAVPLYVDSNEDIEVWVGNEADLPSIGSLAQTYDFAGMGNVTGQSMSGIAMWLDRDRGLWFLAYMTTAWDGIRLKTAPAVER